MYDMSQRQNKRKQPCRSSSEDEATCRRIVYLGLKGIACLQFFKRRKLTIAFLDNRIPV